MSEHPITNELPIAVRAYATFDQSSSRDVRKHYPKKPPIAAAPHTLIFDCETRADSSQSLRFGTYQHRYENELRESGIFYSEATLSSAEIDTIKRYAETHGLDCLTHAEFVKSKFYGIGYDLRATIVGFNLPFDISRIAIAQNSARGAMKGGFTFALCDDKRLPNVQVKHLSARAAFIQFAAPFKNRTNRSLRKKRKREPVRRGHFVDCKTLASALLARSFSLESLSGALGIKSLKKKFDDFDAPVCDEFLDYAVGDTQATWECYQALLAKFDKLGLKDVRPEKIYSEASLGKACLKSMGVKPWRECQPDFDPAIIGKIMASYYGGRSEIGIRRSERQVMLCDFLSMYPTVCTLMGLWRYVIAEGTQCQDATKSARELLKGISLADLQSKAAWRNLAVLVRVEPDADIFPVRANYAEAVQPTIGLNYLTNENGQWFTLADCIAAKLLTSKAPKVIEAISFEPMGKQADLEAFKINGDDAYAIDPAKGDYYKRLIELRQETKLRIKGASLSEKAALNNQQNALKMMANATSYGIFVEMNVEKVEGKVRATVYNGSGGPFERQVTKIEKPGNFFHPLLAALITGAARLMLAITEKLAADRKLEWSFCDTDSMALAKPADIDARVFAESVQSIIDWFGELNPYSFGGSILKSEDVNFSLSGNGELVPLYCYAVSAKRYVLYNHDENGKPIIRKASAHGLGHLRAPYDATNLALGIPKPQIDLANSQLARWQHDIWFKIIEAMDSERPYMVELNYHPAMQLPAIGRYSATSPPLLKWFNPHNESRAYIDQVKPFGFLTILTADNFNVGEEIIKNPSKRRKSKSPLKPIAPFTKDPAIAAKTAFDRNTGEPIASANLKTYAASVRQYHLQPESKFLNGECFNSGKTERRHVRAIRAMHIGKEANDLERQVVLGYDHAAQPAYGYCLEDIAALQAKLKRCCEVFSLYEISNYAEMTAKRLSNFLTADSDSQLVSKEAAGVEKLVRYFWQKERREGDKLRALEKVIVNSGLRKTARDLGVDPSNLNRKLQARLPQLKP